MRIHYKSIFTISATPFFTSGRHWSSNSVTRSSIPNLNYLKFQFIRCYIRYIGYGDFAVLIHSSTSYPQQVDNLSKRR